MTIPGNKIFKIVIKIIFRKRLFIGTVPAYKNYAIGTVPAYKNYAIGTVPADKNYAIGTPKN